MPRIAGTSANATTNDDKPANLPSLVMCPARVSGQHHEQRRVQPDFRPYPEANADDDWSECPRSSLQYGCQNAIEHF